MRYKIIAVFFLFMSMSLIAFGQEFAAQKSKNTITENGQKFYIHQVVKGNTLYNISKVYGVASAIIVKANPEVANGLKVGSEIKIPFGQDTSDDYIYHIVKKKETLFTIAKIYNVKAEDIEKINEIQNSEISPGQYLKIPSFYMNTDEGLLHVEANDSKEASQTKSDYTNYTVKPKETLYTIGKIFGISVDELMRINHLESSALKTDQILLVPAKNGASNDNSQSKSTPEFIEHKVLTKETLFGIARQYVVDISEIQKINELGAKQIQPGQVLLIPRKLNNTGFIEHNVAGKTEKLSKIADEYEVSLSELKHANPNVSEKVKRGESVKIPVGYVETGFAKDESIEKTEELLENASASNHSRCRKQKESMKKMKIVLLMPFHLKSTLAFNPTDSTPVNLNVYQKSLQFIEFYEGALLAARELQSENYDFQLQVFDVTTEADANRLLSKPELSEAHVIISLLYSKSFEIISNFARENKIYLVNVVSKRREIAIENPYVFKVQPNEDALYDKVIQHILENYSDYNIIVARANSYQLPVEFKAFIEKLEQRLPSEITLKNSDLSESIQQMINSPLSSEPTIISLVNKDLKRLATGVDYQYLLSNPNGSVTIKNPIRQITYNADTTAGLLGASSGLRNNLMIAFGTEEVFGIELFTKMNFYKDRFSYTVIGLPNWKEFNGLDVTYTQPLQFQVVTNGFVDYKKPIVKNFVLKFRSEFGKEPESSKYAFLGYDVTKFFIYALANYGNNFARCVEFINPELLENQMYFKKLPEGGYENTDWKIIIQKDYNYQLMR